MTGGAWSEAAAEADFQRFLDEDAVRLVGKVDRRRADRLHRLLARAAALSEPPVDLPVHNVELRCGRE